MEYDYEKDVTMKHYTKEQLRELGARGTARLPCACVRCGKMISVGDPVAWPTTGEDAGQYQCASVVCDNPNEKSYDREKKKAPVVPTPSEVEDARLRVREKLVREAEDERRNCGL